MCKRIFAILLSLLLIVNLALPVFAEEAQETENTTHAYIIKTAEDFLSFGEKCRLDSFSKDLTVSLEADLDLQGVEFSGVPIFCGTFLGNGHTIRGLVLNGEGSCLGLFRYLTDTAKVEQLHLEGLFLPEGSAGKTGALAGSNAGRISGCSFFGTVSGGEYIGGLVGVNETGGIIEDCAVQGHISGNHFVGGIAGKNSGVIRDCENDALVNTTAKQNSVALSDITLESLTRSEASDTVTDIGGIAGSSTGVIRDCVNRGDVGYRHMGYNIGGIAGTQSGYVVDCVNLASIMGRKEVGGIVGQMEPTNKIEYREDALQILERQLNSLGSIVNDTAGNIQGGAAGMYGQMEVLRNAVTDAEGALQSLVPTEEEGLPDLDTIEAAKNTLGSSIADMNDSLRGMGAVTESMVGTLSNNLHSIQNQMNAMRSTLGNADENLGGSITDVSDLDRAEDLSGKAERCVNYGPILADRNVGGIAGAMAVENDLDHEEDVSILGSNSLNFSSELRCVIRDCENRALVTAGKQNAGGIVGWQSLGLVKACRNSGNVEAAGAEYVGGISGQSEGYLRGNGVRCTISGGVCVGGIAGSATVVTDCLSMVKILDAVEQSGAVLGNRKEGYQEEETPISANLYLPIEGDLGGIDGISYASLAEPAALADILSREELPEMFRSVTVTFRYENGGESRFRVIPGEAFPEEKIPALPEKPGCTARWEGLEEADLERVLFDQTFEAVYSAFDSVLSSSDGEKPLLLIQGGFTPDSALEVEDWTEEVPLEEGQTLLKAKAFTVTGARSLTSLRMCIYDYDPEEQGLLIRGQDGTWRDAEAKVDGSYLVAALQEGDNAVAQIQMESFPWLYAAIGGAVLLAALLVLLKKRRKA